MRRPFVLAFALLALLAAPAHANSPSPGAPGLGDRLYPLLGNGGYDALHYDLDLRYGAAAAGPVDGTVTMVARATQSLSRFDLDYAGRSVDSVDSVAVDGDQAKFRRAGEEIVITPRKPIRAGDTFFVTTRYVAVPTVVDPDDDATTAFFVHTAGSATAGQPNLAHLFLPSNDYPSDKASFDIRFDVPAGKTAVANGVQAAQWTDRGRSHFVYVQRQPMATEHASWYEFLYAEENGFLEGDTEGYPDDNGYADFNDLMKAVYAHGDQWRHDDGPVALPLSGDFDILFAFQRYHGGALVLYALRQVVGAQTFQRIERAWVDRYEGESASTDDFIALASQVSGRNLGPFLRDWLYGTKTPRMPGHPDWTVDAVVENAPMGLAAPAARAQQRK